jgi:hypothetical protein
MTEAEQMVRDLRRRTLALIKRKKVRRDRLAVEAEVSYFWLCRYLAEHEDALNPRVGTLAKLEKRVNELERLQ